ALGFYQRFLKRKHADPELRLETARAHITAGSLHLRLGEAPQAVESIQQGITLLEELLARRPDRPEYEDTLVEGWIVLGHARGWLNRTHEAEEAYRTAREMATRLVKAHPRSAVYLHHLARACADLATTYARSRQLPKAAESYREALRWSEQLITAAPENLDH